LSAMSATETIAPMRPHKGWALGAMARN
jgi:hypothetical protein